MIDSEYESELCAEILHLKLEKLRLMVGAMLCGLALIVLPFSLFVGWLLLCAYTARFFYRAGVAALSAAEWVVDKIASAYWWVTFRMFK